jgi:H3 lysine-79-specific histone-lysine N-methyltransferase
MESISHQGGAIHFALFYCVFIKKPSLSYLLLAPKNNEDYNPIEDLKSTAYLIYNCEYCFIVIITVLFIYITVYSGDFGTEKYLLSNFKEAIEARNGLWFLTSFNLLNKWFSTIATAPPHALNDIGHILDQCYSRTVGLGIALLKKHKAASDGVYGEMLPPLIKENVAKTKLCPGSIFLDLGSGVGNMVTQVSLSASAGCLSYGVELSPHVVEVS